VANRFFSSPRDGLPPNLFQKSLASGSEKRRLMHSGINSIATDWSRDGRYVVYMANELGTNWNIWVMPLTGDQTSQPVLRTQFNEMDGRISPDGNWLAYVSDESGKWEVYVQRFRSPGANGKSPATEASSRSGPTTVRNSSMWLPTRNAWLWPYAQAYRWIQVHQNNFSNSTEQAISSVVPMTSVSMASDSS